MEDGKYKILMISDHALSTSGVGVQSRHLVEGLLKKGCWRVRQLGAAVKHNDYRVIKVNDDFLIKPVDGFGDPNMLRTLLATEKPDLLFLFTDPRFFIWLWEMEDEVHQVCPIVYWHVWDNWPKPEFNSPLYEATDLINCHSHLTYEICKQDFEEKTNFIPHALPEGMFFPLPDNQISEWKRRILGDSRVDHFVGTWINRNAKRKRPNDVLVSWSKFLDSLQEKHGHRKATLIMHCDPTDSEGPNLFRTAEMLGISDSVFFSPEKLGFEQMNVIYNISDFVLNISYAEGFGLPTLEGMHCGKPIIAVKTGGLTRQVVDHRDGSENGVALDVDLKSLVGSQMVPYIWEDYATNDNIAAGIMKLHEMDPDERAKLGKKARDYVLSEFAYQNTVDRWHETMLDTIENWRSRYDRVKLETL